MRTGFCHVLYMNEVIKNATTAYFTLLPLSMLCRHLYSVKTQTLQTTSHSPIHNFMKDPISGPLVSLILNHKQDYKYPCNYCEVVLLVFTYDITELVIQCSQYHGFNSALSCPRLGCLLIIWPAACIACLTLLCPMTLINLGCASNPVCVWQSNFNLF